MRGFSDKYSLHLAIALKNFKLVSLVNVVFLFCSICPTNLRNSSMSFHQHTLIFHLKTVHHLSYQRNINIFYHHRMLITVRSEMNWSIISSSAECTRKWARSALAYAFADNICTAVSELYTTWNRSEITKHSITFPILPRKFINRWKPPNLQTTFIDFDFVISTAFNQSA